MQNETVDEQPPVRAALHACGVKGGPPASVIVLSQLQIKALPVHPDSDVPNPGPRVEPGAEGVEGTVIRGQGAPRESDCCSVESASLIQHRFTEVSLLD